MKDYRENYRTFPQHEDEYHRRMRQEIERNETNLGAFRNDEPRYKSSPIDYQSTLNDFQDSLFNRVLEDIKEKTEITPEIYADIKHVTETMEKNPDMPIVELTAKLLDEKRDDRMPEVNSHLEKLDRDLTELYLKDNGFDEVSYSPDNFRNRKVNDSEVTY